jgi:hypothetical protein
LTVPAAAAAAAATHWCQVSAFAELLMTRQRLQESLRAAVSDPSAALRFLQPGRLIQVGAAAAAAAAQSDQA